MIVMDPSTKAQQTQIKSKNEMCLNLSKFQKTVWIKVLFTLALKGDRKRFFCSG